MKAVIVGGGISGLLTARTLSDHYREVVILERDAELSTQPRKGAPQGAHLHTLLKRGLDELEKLFPGFDDDLAKARAPQVDWARDSAWLNPYGWTPRFDSEVKTRSCSRPLLEETIRKRVRKLPNVDLQSGASAQKLIAENQRVVGVRSETGEYSADLVVDASGRNGFLKPPVAARELDARLGYASRRYRLAGRDWKQLYVQLAPPLHQRGGVICPIENDEFVATLIGGNGDYPPRDEKAFLEFAKSLRSPRLYEALSDAEPCGPVHTYRRTGNRLQLFHHAQHWPQGVVALGDAVCCLNPVYAQGMTVAILAAIRLGKHAARQSKGWERKFQRSLAGAVRYPWGLATTEDEKFLSPRLSPPQRYIGRLLADAVRHPRTHHRFLRVLHMLDSPLTLLSPPVMVAALRAGT